MLVTKLIDSIIDKMDHNQDVAMFDLARMLLAPIVGSDDDDIIEILSSFGIARTVYDDITHSLMGFVMVDKGVAVPEEVKDYIASLDEPTVEELCEFTYEDCEYNFREVLKDAYELHLQNMFGDYYSHEDCRSIAVDFVDNLYHFG